MKNAGGHVTIDGDSLRLLSRARRLDAQRRVALDRIHALSS
jgi:hypothetical protein